MTNWGMTPGKLSMDLATMQTIGWFAIHALGLVASWGVRLSIHSQLATLIQCSFFFSLLAVSMATFVGHVYGFETWHLSAATLATMIVLAVVDVQVSRPVTT